MVKRIVLLLFVLFLLPTAGVLAATDQLSIGQVSINKPEVIVFFDIVEESSEDDDPADQPAAVPDRDGELSAEARLGGELLTNVSLKTFEASGEGCWYIFVVDVSTSMTGQQMRAIRATINETAENMSETDRVSIIAFGLTVDVLINLSADKDEISESADLLIANQNGTLFFDAIITALNLAEQYGEGVPERRSLFVFSDAEDYNVGGYVREEVEQRLQGSSVPMYAIGLNNNSRAALDAFGAMARLSGGAIDVVTQATLRGAVMERIANMRSGYVAYFMAKTNIISGEQEELVLNVTQGGVDYNARADVFPRRSIPDNVPPSVESAEQTASGTISIRFDEPMLGAERVGGYRIEDENGDLLALRIASYDDITYTAMLTFSEQPLSGTITVYFPGITDDSMERNAVNEPVTIDFIGAEPTPPIVTPEPLPAPDELLDREMSNSPDPAVWFVGAIVIALIVVGVTLGVIKSRGGLVRVDGKLRFAGNERQEVYMTEESAEAVKYQFITTKPPEIKIRVIDASGKSQDIATPVSGSLFAGRDAGNDLVFDDKRMSRQQFVIEAKDDGFSILNLSGSSATLLNGVPIAAPYPLRQGDKIEAGNMTFLIL